MHLNHSKATPTSPRVHGKIVFQETKTLRTVALKDSSDYVRPPV